MNKSARHVLVAIVALCLLQPGQVAGQTILGSDADFLTWAAGNPFTKHFVGELRSGDGLVAGDWEIGLVNAANNATFAQDNTHGWGLTQRFLFSFDGITEQAGLWAGDPSEMVSHDFSSIVTGKVNTLLIRTKATAGRSADLSNLVLNFGNGESLFLAALAGDLDAEYYLIQDARLATGFSVDGNILLAGGARSDPAVQFKVGTTVMVPEPGTLLLLGTGLLGMVGAAGWRRREEED